MFNHFTTPSKTLLLPNNHSVCTLFLRAQLNQSHKKKKVHKKNPAPSDKAEALRPKEADSPECVLQPMESWWSWEKRGKDCLPRRCLLDWSSCISRQSLIWQLKHANFNDPTNPHYSHTLFTKIIQKVTILYLRSIISKMAKSAFQCL